MYKPKGVYVAMLTPFSDDGSINEPELRKIVDFLVDAGVNGLFPISSVGEFIHMSSNEKMRVMEIVSDQNKGRVQLLPGVGSSHPAESVRLARKAQSLGSDAVVAAPPYFFPQSQDQGFEPCSKASKILLPDCNGSNQEEQYHGTLQTFGW